MHVHTQLSALALHTAQIKFPHRGRTSHDSLTNHKRMGWKHNSAVTVSCIFVTMSCLALSHGQAPQSFQRIA